MIMKNNRLAIWVRLALILCGIALVAVLYFPLWRVELQAPQYPEGLKLLIYPNKLAGNVDIINGLNHYIGMKTLHTADFIEFTLLPYCIGFFVAAFIAVGIMGRKKLLYLLFILFAGFGLLAIYDFWRWEYNYGHNLNPEAAIIVPGMAYQPPLIGFKQLLNFGAYSIPDIGGWVFVSVGVVILFCVIMVWRLAGKNKPQNKMVTAAASIVLVISLSSCNAGPEPIRTGTDNCYSCKMTVSDDRFGAEVLTTKGKVYKFDDMHCLLTFLRTNEVKGNDIKNIYFTNFCADHQLISEKNSMLVQSEMLHSPMGGNVAAFDNADSLQKMRQQFQGNKISWTELNK
jgi:copper chaperone NosL